ncbi:hypothetical protein FF021_16080 [Leptospira noguchii]|nr:hypothetical protein FF021_16080 [Leptospira noguchii]
MSGPKGAKRSRRERAGIREPEGTRLEAQSKKNILVSEYSGERHAQNKKAISNFQDRFFKSKSTKNRNRYSRETIVYFPDFRFTK